MILIGVDNGNANTKTRHHNFVSGITKHDVRPPMAQDLLFYDNAFYTLSNKRNIYKRDKTVDDNTYILTLFAIAKELISRDNYSQDLIEIALGVGLPPGHFGKGHKSFMEYFLRNDGLVYFVYNNKPFNIKIKDVMVYPQAYAAVATRPSDLKQYSVLHAVDIGGYTTDVLKFVNGKPDLSVNYSLNSGVITMNNEIIKRVDTVFDAVLDDIQIQSVLSKSPHVIGKNITDFIEEEAQKYAEDIIFKLKEEGIDLKLSPVIFIGGGSLLIEPFIKNSPNIAKAEFVTSTQANAIGYEELMKASLARKNNL